MRGFYIDKIICKKNDSVVKLIKKLNCRKIFKIRVGMGLGSNLLRMAKNYTI